MTVHGIPSSPQNSAQQQSLLRIAALEAAADPAQRISAELGEKLARLSRQYERSQKRSSKQIRQLEYALSTAELTAGGSSEGTQSAKQDKKTQSTSTQALREGEDEKKTSVRAPQSTGRCAKDHPNTTPGSVNTARATEESSSTSSARREGWSARRSEWGGWICAGLSGLYMMTSFRRIWLYHSQGWPVLTIALPTFFKGMAKMLPAPVSSTLTSLTTHVETRVITIAHTRTFCERFVQDWPKAANYCTQVLPASLTKELVEAKEQMNWVKPMVVGGLILGLGLWLLEMRRPPTMEVPTSVKKDQLQELVGKLRQTLAMSARDPPMIKAAMSTAERFIQEQKWQVTSNERQELIMWAMLEAVPVQPMEKELLRVIQAERGDLWTIHGWLRKGLPSRWPFQGWYNRVPK